MIGYLKNHWFGVLPLWQTFWINLVAIAGLVHLSLEIGLPELKGQTHPYPIDVVGLGILLYLLLFLWQAVGTFRAIENYIRGVGSMSIAWCMQVGILACLWIVAVNAWGLWLTTTVVVETENFAERMEREHASKYTLEVSADGKSVYFQGEITHGVSRNITQLLTNNPAVDTIVLTSDGGNIYEARGLARVFTEANLHTHVESSCSSACTLAFIGGAERSMASSARLGFHQYRVDADYMVAFSDPDAEQARDKDLFAAAGVSEDFSSEMYNKSASDMWFPTHRELLTSGVLSVELQ